MGSANSLESDKQQGEVTGSLDREISAKKMNFVPRDHRTWAGTHSGDRKDKRPREAGRQGPSQVTFLRGRIIR